MEVLYELFLWWGRRAEETWPCGHIWRQLATGLGLRACVTSRQSGDCWPFPLVGRWPIALLSNIKSTYEIGREEENQPCDPFNKNAKLFHMLHRTPGQVGWSFGCQKYTICSLLSARAKSTFSCVHRTPSHGLEDGRQEVDTGKTNSVYWRVAFPLTKTNATRINSCSQ